MNLTFFADHCVPNSVTSILNEAGFLVIKLRDCMPVDSPDSLVIHKAQENKAILISLNGDFSDIVTYPPRNYGGIFSLQIKNHPEVLLLIMEKLITFLNSNPDRAFYQQKLFLVESHRIRIRS